MEDKFVTFSHFNDDVTGAIDAVDAIKIMVGNQSKPITPKTLDKSIEKLLNERLGDEYTAYYFYKNAANWCAGANYIKAAAFFAGEAAAELEHAQGLQDYLTQWNLLPQIPQVETQAQLGGLVDIINKAYVMEYGLFEKYSCDQQDCVKDAATFNFLQTYVNYQNAEVAEYSDLLNALVLIDCSNKLDLLTFEQTYF